jgi:peptide/nickel transport system substrate-binding protein
MSLRLLLSFAAAVLMLVAPPALRAATPANTLVFASGNDANTLDPHFILERPDVRVSMHIHENLVRFSEKGELVPELALSWSESPDKLTWTFKLRPGVKFHDGTPFNAEAVKFVFDRILDPAVASPRRSIASFIKEVKVIDEATVAITTHKPFAPTIAQLSVFNLPIMSPTALKKHGKDYGRNPAGTGPFMFESWKPGERVVLTRNANYWGKQPVLQKLEFRVVPEDSARVLQLLSGEVDVIANLPPVMINRMKSLSAVKVLQETSFRTVLLGVNHKVKPFDDLRVRQALAYALDTKALVNGVLGGVPKRGGGIEAPEIPGARTDLAPYPHDLAKAKKLLADAGYPNGFSTTLLTPTGRILNDRQLAEAMQAQAKEVGINIRIDAPDWATYTKLLNSKEAPLFISSKGNPAGDLDLPLQLVAHSSGQMNFYNWRKPEIDRLIDEQRVTTDVKKRNALLSDIQQRFYDEIPAIVLFYDAQLYAARSNVNGVRLQPNEVILFNDVVKR